MLIFKKCISGMMLPKVYYLGAGGNESQMEAAV
jgi:hypothetical protein